MKVVQLVGWYYPDGRGGTEAYVAALARALHAAGHETWVAAPLAGLEGTRLDMHEGTPVFRYGTPTEPTRAEFSGDHPVRGTDALHAWLASVRPDIVHVHAFVTGLGLAEVRAARAAGARVIVTTHAARLGWLCQRGTMLFEGRTPCDGLAEPAKCTRCLAADAGAWAPLAQAVTALSGRRSVISANLTRQHDLFQEISAFVVLTAWARAAVVANGAPASKVMLNRLGCVPPTGGTKPGPAVHRTTVPIHVGVITRFDHVKGLDVLADALSQVPQAALRVSVFGPVETVEERRVHDAFAAATARDTRVAVGPAVSRDALGDTLRSFDVLCCPSRTAEGGPTIAIEALAVGTPVIGSAWGGLAELVEDGRTGRLVPPEDASALAVLLRDLAERPEQIDDWRRVLPSARTMDAVCADTLALYAGEA
jgi:glycosyltransferase involved in cell wall biosynthesis